MACSPVTGMSSPRRTQASTQQHLLAGLTAGTLTAASLYPIDLVKVRYQVYDKSGSAYRSLAGAFRTIVKEEGVRGLFQGVSPAVLASAVSWGGYFYFYENSKKRKLNQAFDGSGKQLRTKDHLLSGIEAGAYMVFITNPLWLLKTRLQTQHGVELGKSIPKYDGPLDAVKVIFREEGFFGFYKGIVPALFLTSHGAVQFAAYEQLKYAYKSFHDDENCDQPVLVSMTTGILSKVVASTLTYPYQVIKSRLQQRGVLRTVALDTGEVITVAEAKYKGLIDCAIQIQRHEGVKGFFRGLIPNCIKVAPGAAVTFVVYEESLKLIQKYSIGS